MGDFFFFAQELLFLSEGGGRGGYGREIAGEALDSSKTEHLANHPF